MVEPTHLKNMLVKLDHFPKVRGENKKYLKPPPCGWILGRFFSTSKESFGKPHDSMSTLCKGAAYVEWIMDAVFPPAKQ